MQLYVACNCQFDTKLQKCIRMGITIFQNFIGEVYHQIYGKKSYTTFTNFSTKYHLICKVYTDVGGIK